jgi:hypothetical protein
MQNILGMYPLKPPLSPSPLKGRFKVRVSEYAILYFKKSIL